MRSYKSIPKIRSFSNRFPKASSEFKSVQEYISELKPFHMLKPEHMNLKVWHEDETPEFKEMLHDDFDISVKEEKIDFSVVLEKLDIILKHIDPDLLESVNKAKTYDQFLKCLDKVIDKYGLYYDPRHKELSLYDSSRIRDYNPTFIKSINFWFVTELYGKISDSVYRLLLHTCREVYNRCAGVMNYNFLVEEDIWEWKAERYIHEVENEIQENIGKKFINASWYFQSAVAGLCVYKMPRAVVPRNDFEKKLIDVCYTIVNYDPYEADKFIDVHSFMELEHVGEVLANELEDGKPDPAYIIECFFNAYFVLTYEPFQLKDDKVLEKALKRINEPTDHVYYPRMISDYEDFLNQSYNCGEWFMEILDQHIVDADNNYSAPNDEDVQRLKNYQKAFDDLQDLMKEFLMSKL